MLREKLPNIVYQDIQPGLPLQAKVILAPWHSPEKVTVGAGGVIKLGSSFFKFMSLTIGAASASIATNIYYEHEGYCIDVQNFSMSIAHRVSCKRPSVQMLMASDLFEWKLSAPFGSNDMCAALFHCSYPQEAKHFRLSSPLAATRAILQFIYIFQWTMVVACGRLLQHTDQLQHVIGNARALEAWCFLSSIVVNTAESSTEKRVLILEARALHPHIRFSSLSVPQRDLSELGTLCVISLPRSFNVALWRLILAADVSSRDNFQQVYYWSWLAQQWIKCGTQFSTEVFTLVILSISSTYWFPQTNTETSSYLV